MNTKLEHLFENHDLSEKDRYEINQIFELLPDQKKQNLLDNFGALAFRIEKIKVDIMVEQEILIWDSLKRIWNIIKEAKKQQILN